MAEEQAANGAQDGAPKTGGKEKKGFFYGWWIVIGGFMIMATCYTAFVNCMSLFQAQIVGDLGMTIGEYNTGTSLASLISIVGTLIIGFLLDKINARAIAVCITALATVMLFGYSVASAPWHIYLLAALSGTIITAGARLFVSVIITNWFNLKRGFAVSLALCGSAFGGAILSPIVGNIIATSGWRFAFVVLAIICLVGSLPVAVIFFRSYPSDKGLQPYGAELSKEEIKAIESKGKKKVVQADPEVPVAVGWKVMKKSAAFWLLALGFMLVGAINAMVVVNTISNMTSVVMNGETIVTGGHDIAWASTVLSAELVLVVFCKVALGSMYDRLGLIPSTIIGAFTCFAANFFMIFNTTDWGPILAAVFFAFGTCVCTVGPSVMMTKEFGRLDIGKATSIMVAVQSIGGIMGAIVSGQAFDAALSFTPAWIFGMVISVVMGVCMVASVKLARKLVAKQIAAGAPRVDEEGKIIEGSAAAA